ncbi:HNH endonuclease [Burkholderia pseudomallei]|uniref:HNH endonuclease n=1 Tax=Burkholderia pseudomallei TaxID=28450 RepID=UPI0011775809|nr:HNH endonuclease [Burkholderia pseudomallei]
MNALINRKAKLNLMPRRAPTPCRFPGCAEVLASPGYCAAHRGWAHRDYGRARRTFDAELGFYKSSAWQQCRAAYLRAHPLCAHCSGRGHTVAARVVDHVVPIKDGGARLDWANLQSLCTRCHNRKTATETAQRARKRVAH